MITVTGLENNYYLANNPIYLKFTSSEFPLPNYELTLTIGARVVTIQMYSGFAILDIAPIVKSLMSKPDFNDPNSNIIVVDVELFWYSDEVGNTVNLGTKSFIRGGQYAGQNNYLSSNTILKVS